MWCSELQENTHCCVLKPFLEKDLWWQPQIQEWDLEVAGICQLRSEKLSFPDSFFSRFKPKANSCHKSEESETQAEQQQ